MTKFYTLLYIVLFALGSISGYSQQNMTLLANDTINDSANDIWGWADDNGIEYAIMGAINSVRIYSLEDPQNPNELANIAGDRSTWRDIKTHENFAYVIADRGNDGVLIIDMSTIEDSLEYEYFNPVIQEQITSRFETDFMLDTVQVGDSLVVDTTFFTVEIMDTTATVLQTCHNLFIEDGHIYFAGCNNFNGVQIYDIRTTPKRPQLVGIEDEDYAHDVYVNGNTMFASEIFGGKIGIYDVTDKSNPTLLGAEETGMRFTHNAWTNDDATVVFTTDERANAFVEAYDISNLPSINLISRFRPLATEGRGVIPHNTHYLDGFLYTSYYTDGIVVTDATKPDNLIQVGQFDTFNGRDGGFNGSWGAYPFLPSGLILASDIQTGLYVIQSDVQRACYLEGIVTDATTGEAINNVNVEIISDDINRSLSEATGEYKTGQATAGTFQVRFTNGNYVTQVIEVTLVNGECTNLNVQLEPVVRFDVGITVREANSIDRIGNTSIRLFNEVSNFEFNSNAGGATVMSQINEGVYTAFIGSWGFQSIIIDSVVIDGNQQFNFELEEGFVDDFLVDLGWTVSGTPETGQWVLDEPIATTFGSLPSNVDSDLSGDLGNSCFMTGNGGGNAGDDDVDGGIARLTSPLTDISSFSDPLLNYSAWFFNDGGNAPIDDTLDIYVQRGEESVLIESITGAEGLGGMWMNRSNISIQDAFPIMDSLQFVFETSDLENGHLVEAALDGFSLTDGIISPTVDVTVAEEFTVYPNPAADLVTLQLPDRIDISRWSMSIIDVSGKHYDNAIQLAENNQLNVANLQAGLYIITFTNRSLNEQLIGSLVKI